MSCNLELPDSRASLCFGPFTLYPLHYLLLQDGEVVPLGSRAMLLLIALATRAGELMGKHELLGLVWPNMVVEECNLRTQVKTLRRILGNHGGLAYIATLSGQGYRFVAPVTTQAFQPSIPLKAPVIHRGSHVPYSRQSIIGRDRQIETLGEQLLRQRFVTITGPGGIGKTALAAAVANQLADHFPLGIVFVDLAPLSDSSFSEGMLAAALEVSCAVQSVTHACEADKQLLILDNCEHCLQEVAIAVEGFIVQSPRCCILITSRQALHAEAEFVHELVPLPVPECDQPLASSLALSYASIALFVERITANDPGFVLRDADVPAAAAICRMLDGNALAIEMAALRVPTFGLTHLKTLLDSDFRLQMMGRRTAPQRHRTLAAALDWTYTRLLEDERAIVRQLSVFTGAFSVTAVKAVVAIGMSEAEDLTERLEKLLEKSLLIAVAEGPIKSYRLAHTTRLYAHEKLFEHQELRVTAQRHAVYTLSVLRQSVKDLDTLTPDAWLDLYGAEIDAVRAALHWAYAQDGDTAAGVEITLMSVPLWLRLCLINECHGWLEKGSHSAAYVTSVMPRQYLRLLATLANATGLAKGCGLEVREAWKRVIETARPLCDTEHELRGLWGLWSDRCCSSHYHEALELAGRYVSLSQTNDSPDRQLLGSYMQAVPLFYTGDLRGAQQMIGEALDAPISSRTYIFDLHCNQRTSARAFQAHIQLLQGDVRQALLTIDSAVKEAMAAAHPASLWGALCLNALPIALLVNHGQKSQHFFTLLQASVNRENLPIWSLITRCFEYVLMIRDNHLEAGIPLLGEALIELRNGGGDPLYSLFRSEYAQGLAWIGLHQQGLDVIEDTLCTSAGHQEHWFHSELLRIKAQLLLRQGDPASRALVHELLQKAMCIAEQQGAGFWIARISADLARLKGLRLIK